MPLMIPREKSALLPSMTGGGAGGKVGGARWPKVSPQVSKGPKQARLRFRNYSKLGVDPHLWPQVCSRPKWCQE